jgi:hypothetical protein
MRALPGHFLGRNRAIPGRPTDKNCCWEAQLAQISVRKRPVKGLPDDHNDIPVWNAENWFFEDLEIGDKLSSFRRTVTEGELVLYCEHLMTALYQQPENFVEDVAALAAAS